MHAEVVTALDAHLAEVQSLRRRLTKARAIEPGERLEVVLQVAASAERLAHAMYAHSPVGTVSGAAREGTQPPNLLRAAISSARARALSHPQCPE